MAVSPDVDVMTGATVASDGDNEAFWSAVIVEDIKMPDPSVESIQTTGQGTTGGHTFMPPRLQDNGTFECVVQVQQDTRPTVGRQADDSATEGYTVTWPDTNTDTFEGFVMSAPPQSAPIDGKILMDVVVKISGDIS